MTEGVFELFDENYSDQLGFWMRQGLRQKYEGGRLLGLVPVGYKAEGHGRERRLVADPRYSLLIREGFERYITGLYSDADMAAWAVARSYRNRNGRPFTESSWRTILTNPSYAGYASYKRKARRCQACAEETLSMTALDCRHCGGPLDPYELRDASEIAEPLIPFSLFQKALDVRKARRSRSGNVKPMRHRTYLLSGLAFCDDCGATFRGQPHRGKRYFLHTGPRDACGAAPRFFPVDPIEEQMEEYVGTIELPPDYIERTLALLRQRLPADEHKAHRERLRQEIERAKRLYILGDLTEAEYVAEVASRRRELALVEAPPAPIAIERAAAYLATSRVCIVMPPRTSKGDLSRPSLCRCEFGRNK